MTFAGQLHDHIRDRFSEGLTGIFALGGTRTTYLIAHPRDADDSGHIPSLEDYANYGFGLLKDLIAAFFEMGGQNLVVSVLSYQQLKGERGVKYAAATAALTSKLMEGDWIDFYHDQHADPYFVGIDTLLHLPPGFVHDLGATCQQFNESWQYREGSRKLVWEIAPIPLYSFWRAPQVLGQGAQAELDEAVANAADLQSIHDLLYRHYTRAAYGTDLPVPHFYIGSNRKGDLKLRSMLPISLLCGDACRFFYLPYPSLMLTRAGLQAILEDLVYHTPARSTQIDYSGQTTPEEMEREYQRAIDLSTDPASIVGLARSMAGDDD
jgi:hypothetical protein